MLKTKVPWIILKLAENVPTGNRNCNNSIKEIYHIYLKSTNHKELNKVLIDHL